MNWMTINENLIQAAGRGFAFSVRKLTSDEYLVKKDSFTNGTDRAKVRTQAEGIALAERWEASHNTET